MRTCSNKRGSKSGTVLVLTLVLALLLGSTLASYLYWVRTQNLLVAESQAWNAALAITEAGVEEGMAQINVNVGNIGSPNLLNYSPSISTNGWGAGPVYSKGNSVFGYSVIVSNDVPPTIYSTGTSSVPVLGKPVTRTVMVKTTTNSLFGVAIAAMTSINNKGNDITVDAYDAADTVHFTNGLYNSTYAFAGGDVSLAAGIVGLGNSDIHGRLYMGPSGSYNLGPNGLVGDMPANWPAQSGVETPTENWLFNDFNKDFADVTAPYGSGLDPNSYYYGTSNTYYLGNGNYYLNSDFTLNNNQILYVAGATTLYVTGNFNAKNGSQIAIGPGGILKLYLGTTAGPAVSCVFNIVNSAAPNNAFNLQVFGLPSLTSFTLGGNDTYMGTLYAPEAVFTLSGGGSSTLDYQGAVVVSSITMNGHFKLHYDKNLSRVGPPKGYTLAYWYEL